MLSTTIVSPPPHASAALHLYFLSQSLSLRSSLGFQRSKSSFGLPGVALLVADPSLQPHVPLSNPECDLTLSSTWVHSYSNSALGCAHYGRMGKLHGRAMPLHVRNHQAYRCARSRRLDPARWSGVCSRVIPNPLPVLTPPLRPFIASPARVSPSSHSQHFVWENEQISASVVSGSRLCFLSLPLFVTYRTLLRMCSTNG